MAVSVHEATMVLPDVVCVEVRDSPIVPGELVNMGAGDSGSGTYSISGTADNGQGEVRLTVSDATWAASSSFTEAHIYGILGTIEANGMQPCRQIDATHVDLIGTRFQNAYVSGGRIATMGWYTRNHPNKGDAPTSCHIVGFNGDYLRFEDEQPGEFLDRAAADVAGNYGAIGARTVTNVYRISMPYTQGITQTYGNTTSFRHFLFLKLNGALAEGSYTIDFPAGTGLANYSFNFDDKVTRASCIHSTQVGHRAGDTHKAAVLSAWVPGYGTHGAVDFSAHTEFYVIDAEGAAVGGPYPITLMLGPTDTESALVGTITPTASRDADGRLLYPSTTVAPKTITAVSKANPGRITIAGHGLSNGDRQLLRGMSGMTQLEGAVIIVADVTTDDFAIGSGSTNNSGIEFVDTSAFGDLTTGTYLTGFENKAYTGYFANRAATYTYLLDYSAFQGPTGTYRCYIAGIGVSDPWEIAEDIHYRTAANSAKGFYHQLNGTSLDGRFGYTRGTSHADSDTKPIYWSYIPGPFSSELQYAGTIITSSYCGMRPRITTTRATDWGPGPYFDAGDHDAFIVAHAESLYLLLDYCVDKMPAGAQPTSFNFPKASAINAVTYAGTDSMPDAFHQFVYYLDTFRRQQTVGGAVPSGVGYSSPTYGGGQGGYDYEPSDISSVRAFVYAADEASNFLYAGLAAKFASVCYQNNLDAIGDIWLDSAELAWDWAVSIYDDSGTGGARDAYYKTAQKLYDPVTFTADTTSGSPTLTNVSSVTGLVPGMVLHGTGLPSGTVGGGGLFILSIDSATQITLSGNATANGTGTSIEATITGWTSTNYSDSMTSIRALVTGQGYRFFAAAALFRATGLQIGGTGTTTYKNIIENAYQLNTGSFLGHAVWEYIFANGANASHVSGYESVIVLNATNTQVTYSEGNSYLQPTASADVYLSPGIGRPSDQILRAYIIDGGAEYFELILRGLQYAHGVNQQGLCCTTGLGVRNTCVLHRDREAKGIATPAGYTTYTWAWVVGASSPVFNFSTDSPANFTVSLPTGDYEAYFGTNRLVEPWHHSFPAHQAHFENTYIIYCTEFTTEQSIIPMQILAMWAHGWDGNVSRSVGTRYIQRTLS